MKNDKVAVFYHEKSTHNPRPYFMVRDLTDTYNETSAYTRKIRGIEKAHAFLTQIFNDERLKNDLNFWDIIKLLDKFNLNTHTYCAVD